MREYLKELRRKAEMSQLQAARKAGIVQSYYAAIESGARQSDMTLSIMQKLAGAFNVTVERIIEQENLLKKDSV